MLTQRFSFKGYCMAASRSLRLSFLALILSSVALIGCEGAVDPAPKDAEPPPACGDGKRDEGEECDDGNLVDGDGCSSECTIERRVPECEGAVDGSPCYQGERICKDGFCIIPECQEASDCEARACVEAAECLLGECIYGATLADDTECGDGRVCRSGSCVSSSCTSDSECPRKSSCHAESSCDFASLECLDGAQLANGTACEGGGVCVDGECQTVECTSDDDCAHNLPCRAAGRCDLSTFECEEPAPLADRTACTTVGGSAGYCYLGECSGRCLSDDECDNGEECDGVERCSPTLRCATDPATRPAEGAACGPAGEGGVCTAEGVCLPGACTSDSECQPSDSCRGFGACVGNVCQAPPAPLPDGTSCGPDEDGVCIDGHCDLNAECRTASDCEAVDVCAVLECGSDYTCALASDQSGTDGIECELGGASGICADGECAIPVCGNGIVEPGEHCDDGNTDAGDGCSARCRLELFMNLGEFKLVDPNVFLPDSLDETMVSACQNFTSLSVDVDGETIPAFNSQLTELGTLTLIIESVPDISYEPILFIQSGGLPSRLIGSYDDLCIPPPPSGVLTPGWGDAAGALNQPTDECLTARFEGTPPIARLNLAGALVDLHEFALGAEWQFEVVDDEPSLAGLKNGTLRAFLRDADAEDATLSVGDESIPLSAIFSGGAESCRPANEGAPDFERDIHDGHNGWWLFFNFEGAVNSGPG